MLSVRQSLVHMPIEKTLKFIGVGCVMPAIVKKQKNVLVVSLLYKDPDIKKEISASALVPNMSGCKWPIGHPGDDDFYFCGKPTIPGKPYCGEHCLIAYRRKDSHQKVKKFFKLTSEA